MCTSSSPMRAPTNAMPVPIYPQPTTPSFFIPFISILILIYIYIIFISIFIYASIYIYVYIYIIFYQLVIIIELRI